MGGLGSPGAGSHGSSWIQCRRFISTGAAKESTAGTAAAFLPGDRRCRTPTAAPRPREWTVKRLEDRARFAYALPLRDYWFSRAVPFDEKILSSGPVTPKLVALVRTARNAVSSEASPQNARVQASAPIVSADPEIV